MSRITLFGLLTILLGAVAHFLDCPYGVHMIIVGAVLAVVGFFVRTPRRTTTV